MKRHGVWLCLLLVACPLWGCAALFAQKSTDVPMESTPGGAEVWVDGAKMGVTPCTVHLTNKKSYTVTFKKDGQETTAQLSNKVGAGWVVLDVLGGLIPVVVDAATGSWYKLEPKTVAVKL